MEDREIVQLYLARSEQAISESDRKYGGYCYRIAYRILENREDSEERVSDTFLAAWNCIPPHRPQVLPSFLGRITRNLSIDFWRKESAHKRGSGELHLALDELRECVSDKLNAEDAVLRKELLKCIDSFLAALPEQERAIFLCRYWYVNSMKEISEKTGCSVGKVKTSLHRTRLKLRKHLELEGLL